MRIPFKLETQGQGSQEVKTAYADVIALEEHFGINASDLQETQRAVWMAFLAWHALRRTGGPDAVGGLKFDEWKDQLLELEDGDGEAPAEGTAESEGNS